MASERGLQVLKAIIEAYVATREPVGSRSIVDRYSFGVSAATIRNDMALLEEEDLISAPHTSAGRVPTDKGYRLFVDTLKHVRGVSDAQRRAIELVLDSSDDLERMLEKAVVTLSKLTNQLAVVQYPRLGEQRIRHVEFVDLEGGRMLVVVITDRGQVQQRMVELGDGEHADFIRRLRERLTPHIVGADPAVFDDSDPAMSSGFPEQDRVLLNRVLSTLGVEFARYRQDKLVVAGASNLLRREHDFRKSVLPVLDAIEQQVELLRLMGEMPVGADGVSVTIGRENDVSVLQEAALVTGVYGPGGVAPARVGVIGPTRMDYSANIATVQAVAQYLSKILGRS